MDNLHFIHNNILVRFFKELTKYKNDYISIVFKLYIYIYMNYTMHLNVYFLSISMHMHESSEKIQLGFNWILNSAPRVPFNF